MSKSCCVTATTPGSTRHWKIPLLFLRGSEGYIIWTNPGQVCAEVLSYGCDELSIIHIIPSFIAGGTCMDHLTKPLSSTCSLPSVFPEEQTQTTPTHMHIHTHPKPFLIWGECCLLHKPGQREKRAISSLAEDRGASPGECESVSLQHCQGQRPPLRYFGPLTELFSALEQD